MRLPLIHRLIEYLRQQYILNMALWVLLRQCNDMASILPRVIKQRIHYVSFHLICVAPVNIFNLRRLKTPLEIGWQCNLPIATVGGRQREAEVMVPI